MTAIALVALLYPRTIKSDVEEATQICVSIESLSETPTIEEMKWAVDCIANKYGLNKEQLNNTIQGESGFSYNPEGWNDGGLAYGVAQFHKPTFDGYCKGDYYSPKDQLTCMGEMWSNGLQYHWSKWKELYGGTNYALQAP